MNTNDLIMNTALFEGLLRIYKSQMIHEIKLEHLNKVRSLNPKTAKEKALIKKQIKEIELNAKKSIERCEKYNCETVRMLDDRNVLSDFIENTIDMYSELSQLLQKCLKDASKTNPKRLRVCVLEENEKGTLFHDGKKYIING